MNKEYVLSRLQAGETLQTIGDDLAKFMNEAMTEYTKIQEAEEAAKKAEEEAELKRKKKAAMMAKKKKAEKEAAEKALIEDAVIKEEVSQK